MYSVGQFSRICGMSVKTLHHYDEVGLLKPARIDPETGYRYYDYGQIRTALQIRRLKDCRLPLNRIAEWLNADNPVTSRTILTESIHEVERSIEELRQTKNNILSLLNELETNKPLMPVSTISDCFEEMRKDTWIYSIREAVPISGIDDLVRTLLERLYALKLEVEDDARLMTIFHDDEIDPACTELEVGLAVQPSFSGLPGTRSMEGGKHVGVEVEGPYSELPFGYAKLIDYIRSNGYTIVGRPFEMYITGLLPPLRNSRDFRCIKPNLQLSPLSFVTRLYIPVNSD